PSSALTEYNQARATLTGAGLIAYGSNSNSQRETIVKTQLVSKSVLAILGMVATGWLVATFAQPANNLAAKPEPRKDTGWLTRHESFIAKAKAGGVDVLFLGDSNTQGWDGNGKE